MVLISYDINTQTKDGQIRLRKVARQCVNKAQRVQNSVFEANLDYGTFLKLKTQLLSIINVEKDSIRFYYLGNNWHKRVEHFGKSGTYDSEGVLIL